MDKYVITIAFRRHTHSMEMQVAGIIEQAVPEADVHYIARARPEHRRRWTLAILQSRGNGTALACSQSCGQELLCTPLD
jgi:hypothetical protein